MAEPVDASEHLRAVADQVALTDRVGDLAVFDQVGLGHAENEIAGGGVDLPSAELRHVHTGVGVGDDRLGVVVTGGDVGVGHPHHREVLVALAAAVSRGQTTLLAGPELVPHVVGEHTVLNQDVVAGRTALVVDGEVAPLAGHGAVVDERDQRGGDLLADTVREDDAPLPTKSASRP